LDIETQFVLAAQFVDSAEFKKAHILKIFL
jgi:hypothetical protein